MPIVQIQQAFNGGVMAPFVHSRADIDKYRAGMRQGDNLLPTPFGPIRRRPGTYYVENCKTNSTPVRVLNFDISNDDGYVLEMGVGYLRFYRDRARIHTAGTVWSDGTAYTLGQVVSNGGSFYICTAAHTADDGGTGGVDDGAGDNEPGVGTDAGTVWTVLTTVAVPPTGSGFSSGFSSGFGGLPSDAGIYEIPTPYVDGELFNIQIAQVNDIMYLVHPNHPVKKLSRYSDTEWRFEDLEFSWPPLRDANAVSGLTLTPSAVTGTITLTASDDYFTSAMVGGYMQVTHQRSDTEYEIKKDLTAAVAASSAIKVRGDYQVRTVGVSAATITIEESATGAFAGEEVQVRTIVTSASENFLFTRTTGSGSGEFRWVRINHTAGITGSSSPYAILEALSGEVDGWVEITGYTSPTQVTVTVGSTLYSTSATDIWSEGAFSDRRGHPRAVTLHELRLCFGGTESDRQTLWMSRSDDFPNFEGGTLDDHAIRYQVASTEHNEINWLVSQKQLLIGTSGGEWVFDSGRDEEVITPSNRRARRHSNNGSEYRQALPVGSSALFTLSGGERIGDLAYVFENDAYQADDLNMLSYDLTRGGIVQLAYQKKRYPLIWCVVAGAGLAAMAYNKRQEVTGWSPVKSPGGSDTDVIESVAVVGRAGDEDEVWVTVRRTINGFVVRYVERLDSDAFDKQEDATRWDDQKGLTTDSGTNLEDLCFLDSAHLAVNGGVDNGDGTFTIAGLDHLVGEDVVIYADGARVGDTETVNGSGQVTIEASALTQAVIGLGFASVFRTLPLFNMLQTGSARGREMKIDKAVLVLHRSGVFKVRAADDPNGYQEVSVRSTDIAEGDPTPLFDGDLEVTLEGRHSLDPSVEILVDDPGPFTMEALILKLQVHGDN